MSAIANRFKVSFVLSGFQANQKRICFFFLITLMKEMFFLVSLVVSYAFLFGQVGNRPATNSRR